MDLITHVDELPAYAPPGHSGTRNRRLVDRGFCGRFEMILGELASGGTADPHAHADEHQVIYVLSGLAEVTLGDRPPVECGPGTVVRIPPGLTHGVVARGDAPLRLVVVYSPPLPPREDAPLAEPRP